MAMPPGNVTPATVAPGVGHWIPDERDGFISWLRAEFAAANAMIDLLCQHLRAIGDHNEYEAVMSSIHHRRQVWSPVLHMQQFFPVTEVAYTLQQVAWKRQQQQQQQPQPSHQRQHYGSDQSKFGGGRDFRRSGPGFNKHNSPPQRVSETLVKDERNTNIDCHSLDRPENQEETKLANGDRDENTGSFVEEKKDCSEEQKIDQIDGKNSEDLEKLEVPISENQSLMSQNCNSDSKDTANDVDKVCEAKTFVVEEVYDKKMINVVEGLKVYDKLLDASEVSQLVSRVNDLRISGRRGQLQGQAYVPYKRPNRGHGREMIQLGLPIADAPDDETLPGTTKDRRIEPIPTFLLDIIERLVSQQITPVKPDVCVIDFFNEGDHSQPHMFVPWFGRPVTVLSLSDCDISFGRVILTDHSGDYSGSLKLSFTPGSVFVVEDKAADLGKYAIHSTRKQRILITFTKSQPRKSMNWNHPQITRQPNHHIRPPKHYPGVLPTPANGTVQPLFIPSTPPLAPQIPFPRVPVPTRPTVWPIRHQPPPRMPLPGTGVFLPPGSADPSTEPVPVSSDKSETSNGNNSSAEVKLESVTKEACNGNAAEECSATENGSHGNGNGNGED